MLGKDYFRVDSNVDMSQERARALILFYMPLIGNDAYSLYNYLCVKGSSIMAELNGILNSLNISIDHFENCLATLNRYRLVRTLKKRDEEKYILILNNPLTSYEFIADDILVREFILKTSGAYYQSLIANMPAANNYQEYDDVSAKLDLSSLNRWSEDKESFIKDHKTKDKYRFSSIFDINVFLRDLSYGIFPLRYRNEENLKAIADLADIYNISYDKMRIYVKEAASYEGNNFDLNHLKKRCMFAESEYRQVEKNAYRTPCSLYLMNLQNGKELTPVDKRILANLSNDYYLPVEVINVLLEHSLKACDNRLLEKYIYPAAADLHRAGIASADAAIERLDRYKGRKIDKDNSVSYDDSANPVFSLAELNELMNNRGNND